MNQTSLDKQSGGAEDGTIARVVRLETNMDNVASILASLQKREEEHFQFTLARMDHYYLSLLDRIDRTSQSTKDSIDRVNDRIDRLAERHGRDMLWVIGLLVTNTAAIVGIAIRLIAT